MNEKVVETEGSFRKQRNEKGCLGRKQCSVNKLKKGFTFKGFSLDEFSEVLSTTNPSAGE